MTYQLQGNYGAILQNYALQTFLKSIGHTPVTIQWETAFNSWKDYLRGIYYLLKNWNKTEYHVSPTLPGHFRLHKENGGRRKFVKRNIRLSKTCLIDNLMKLMHSEKYDALIVGSDQVWRPSFIENISIMFFSFAQGLDVRRIAYAASFGVSYNDFSPEQLQECRTLLENFDCVSVREDSAIDQCRKLFGYQNVSWMPDPTFLIPKSYYENCCHDNVQRNNVLFAYILDNDNEKLAYINKFASQHNLEAIIRYEGGVPTDTVEDWLALFRDAEYVVTDSFHGTVFSLIFHRNFTLFKNQYRGNIRLESLSRQMGIYEYCVEDTQSYSTYFPDWNQIELTIQKWRKIGADFLISNLKK